MNTICVNLERKDCLLRSLMEQGATPVQVAGVVAVAGEMNGVYPAPDNCGDVTNVCCLNRTPEAAAVVRAVPGLLARSIMAFVPEKQATPSPDAARIARMLRPITYSEEGY